MEPVAVVGLDLHKEFTQAVTLSSDGKVLESTRIANADHRDLAAFFARFPKGTDVVMEATFSWPWVADLAEVQGLEPHLGHATRLRELAKGLAKNDRKDAMHVAKLWLAGEVFPESYLAPADVRHRRSRFRLRALLVKVRTQMKNSIHGVLHKAGVQKDDVTDLFGRQGRAWLARVPLPAAAREEIDRKLAVLDDVGRHVDAVEEALRVELKEDPRATLLQSMPGVGTITAYGWLAEIGEVSRFPNGRALAAYAGLLPLDNASAGEDHGKRTNHRCNQLLRLMTIEAVQGALRTSPRMRRLFERVRARHTATPGKAVIAVAREMIEIAQLLLTRGVRYQEEPGRRPGASAAQAGSSSNDHSEHSGTSGSRRASQMGRSARLTRGQAHK